MGLTFGPGLSRRRFAAATLALIGTAAWPAWAAIDPESEDARLMALLRGVARQEDALDPLGSIYRGGTLDPAAFRLLYTDKLDRAKRGVAQQALASLKRIDRRKLSGERQISYDVFQGDKRQDLASLRPEVLALTTVRPFNHFGGLHIEFHHWSPKMGR